MDWAAHDHRPPAKAPVAEPSPLATLWTLISRHGRRITCAIYPAPAGRFEVRANDIGEEIIRTQVVRSREAAEDVGAIWKIAAVEKGFRELA